MTKFSILNPKDIIIQTDQNGFSAFGGITEEQLFKELESAQQKKKIEQKKEQQQQMMINLYFESVKQMLLTIEGKINTLQKDEKHTGGVYGVILETKLPGLMTTYNNLSSKINILQQQIIDAKEGEAMDLIQEFQVNIQTLMQFAEHLKEFES